MASRGFYEDKCNMRASALTFYTLLSIVPVVAMGFGISKGFGSDKFLEKQLLEKFPGQEPNYLYSGGSEPVPEPHFTLYKIYSIKLLIVIACEIRVYTLILIYYLVKSSF